ncbi:hypothetical protein MSG28_008497 [Choristoneura fumiferana]|uniref:Uncharacterized protein n=1 Tax=Choristoneura fumiferana TaxID=7141 RepID=A0ACC0J5V6_CHOFU|nr:hypothetical protein MSG28_008497 [Choristoneura fumiferana]
MPKRCQNIYQLIASKIALQRIQLHVVSKDNTVVAFYHGLNSSYKPVAGKAIHWPGGRRGPPLDTPRCGFLGTDPMCQGETQTVIIYCFIGLAVFLTLAVTAACVAYNTLTKRPHQASCNRYSNEVLETDTRRLSLRHALVLQGYYDIRKSRLANHVHTIVTLHLRNEYLAVIGSLRAQCVPLANYVDFRQARIDAELNNMAWRVRPEEVLVEVGTGLGATPALHSINEVLKLLAIYPRSERNTDQIGGGAVGDAGGGVGARARPSRHWLVR